MQTKNIYEYPISEDKIEKIVYDPPTNSHRMFVDPITGDKYDETNAVDFLCEEGTRVKASLEGKVVAVFNEVKDTWNKLEEPPADIMTLEKTSGNYVLVKHSNEEFSVYCHLKLDGIKVQKGQVVNTGDFLGYSGNTGWSLKPHVHYLVFKFVRPDSKSYNSLKIKFRKDD